MTEKNKVKKVHSEDYFGEYRDYWWNQDFLSLMGTRLKFERIKTMLDVGCGIGHWGQLLTSVLPKGVQVTGIDQETSSLQKASERAKQQGLSDRFQYQQGDAQALPFPEASFDMVTCQTVLIHLKDPKQGLKEMLRVLKPGGLLLAAEPNNFANRAIASNMTQNLTVDEVMHRLKFDLTIQRGKKALGLGFNSVGDLIPGYLAQLGAGNIQVYVSDKAVPFISPYDKADQQANIQQMYDWVKKDFLGWDRDEMHRYYVAGGGNPLQFDFYWDLSINDAKETLKEIEAGTYHTAGGCVSYLVSGTKLE
jgi:ubiquinone/menaquinone biosynthesis C-methylase UbiE